jgi:hypothetical protein
MTRKLICVLGMHRSGTSATVGTIQQHGVELGRVSESNSFNRRGSREPRALVRLHEQILKTNGGTWWQPPGSVVTTRDDLRRRDKVLAGIPGERVAVKDPRMLLLVDFWRDLDPLWIGVIRNPVAVRRSLERRARAKGGPELDGERWEALWRHYNTALLAELERATFPVVDFDRSDELDAQVRGALARHGLGDDDAEVFFDPGLVREGADADWRERVISEESVELWERLAAFARE